jgi:ribosomal protein S12 methylthiotransferase accessory factor
MGVRPGPAIAVVGEGLLADTIAAELARDGGTYRIDRTDPAAASDACRMVVVADDGWDTDGYSDVRRKCSDLGLPWLPVRAELGRVVIGPVERVNSPGCIDCAELRRRLAHPHPQGYDSVWDRCGDLLRARPSSLLTRLAADVVAGLVGREVASMTTDPDSARTRCALLYLDLHTLRVSRHGFLPDPLCPHCGGLPDDAAELARIALKPRPKTSPDNYRVRAVADEMESLLRTYVDAETGVVRTIFRGDEGGLAVAGAPFGLRSGRVESGYGRTRSYRASGLTALLEALERYGGFQPGGKRTTVRAGYREIADDAIDPRTLGLHSPDSHRRPGFPFEPFDEDQPYPWVWAYSFAKQAPVLVPESCAYYGVPRLPFEPARFLYESSNGCALGGCLEEAILYGILEVAERDAFLMTWYARMQVPRIDPSSARDRTIPLIVDTLEAQTDYQVMIFDTTLEQGIPCSWVMAVDPTDTPGRSKAVCAAASHLDPERAIENALSELGPVLINHNRIFAPERARARAMTKDPSLVKAMTDHTLLYGDAAAFPRLSFLTESPDVRSIADSPRPADFGNADLGVDLRHVVNRYLDHGLDIIVVDQTTPEHRTQGFSCVKVIVPGTLPMTFGHHARRVEGIPRLYEVPKLLGYRERRLEPADINPHPHPFP